MVNLKELFSKEKFILYLVTDDRFLPKSAGRRDLQRIKDIIISGVEGGVKIFQYRAKKLDASIQVKQAEFASRVCKENKIVFFVNDRADLALLVEADGIHLGQEDIPPPLVRKFFPNLYIGFSTHNLKQVRDSIKIQQSVDYISFGPIFGTRTKENPYPKTGLSNLKKAVSISSIPIVAIGGINAHNISDVVKTGVRAVASISFILENPKEIERRCKLLIKSAYEFICKS